ncbi:MAG: HAD-IA family hydrolase [Planctomycetia bacterium]|nr:HAD-IA family hydrolase [Planctomycetia bacterium]
MGNSAVALGPPPLSANHRSANHTPTLLLEPSGVLYEATVWRRWLLRLLSRMGLSFSYDGFCEIWEYHYLPDIHSGRSTLKHSLSVFLRASGLPAPQADEVVSAAAARHKALESEPHLFPGVAAALEQLSQHGVGLAISADCDLSSAELRGKLEQLGIAGRFRHIVSSRDLGRAKPEPVCYLAAVTALGLSPASVTYVGCRSEDLTGAREAGLATVSVGGYGGPAADQHVARFGGLVEMFAGTTCH